MARVRVPAEWFKPRPYQLPFLRALDAGFKRIAKVWHRRAGKDLSDLAAISRATQLEPGNYYHIFPTYTQGRKVIWDGQFWDKAAKVSRKLTSIFPKEIIDGKPNQQEMKITFRNGSIFQVIGADRMDNNVGTNPRGIVLSEFSLMRPSVWDLFRPILAENGGWAIFNGTPRGPNHFKRIFETAKADPEHWFSSLLTAYETGAMSAEVLEQERREIILKNGDDAMFRQEYLVSFEASILGSYYGHTVRQAREEGRIGLFPYSPDLPVYTVWDLGVGDATFVIYWQIQNGIPTVVAADEFVNLGLPQVLEEIGKRRAGWKFAGHYAPHDIKNREWGTGKTRIETGNELGINFEKVPEIPVYDGIESGRKLLSYCRINELSSKALLDALDNYSRKWDEIRRIFAEVPNHDWASHGADTFRYSSLIDDLMMAVEAKRRAKASEKTGEDLPHWGKRKKQHVTDGGIIIAGW